jgi:hypothetical protein
MPPDHRLGVALGAGLAALLFVAPAEAQPTAAETTLASDGPFDRSCVAPACASGVRLIVRGPPLVAASAERASLEGQLWGALDAPFAAAVAAPHAAWSNRATQDVFHALLASVGHDPERLKQSGGLGTASLRAALVYAVDRALPVELTCIGPARIDSIYEGLALTPIGSFGFTEARRSVASGCVGTAHWAEHFVDRLVIGSVAQVAPLLEQIERLFADVSSRCDRSLPELDSAAAAALGELAAPAGSSKVSGLTHALLSLRQAGPLFTKVSAQLGDECMRALSALHDVDPAPMAALVPLGLADADVHDLATDLSRPLPTCTSPESCAARDALASTLTTLGHGTALSREQLSTMLAILGASVVPSNEEGSVALAALKVLQVAVVDRPEGATVDPEAVVRELGKTYDVVDGRPSLRTLGRVLGFKPTPWILEMNGGIPQLESHDLHFKGD